MKSTSAGLERWLSRSASEVYDVYSLRTAYQSTNTEAALVTISPISSDTNKYNKNTELESPVSNTAAQFLLLSTCVTLGKLLNIFSFPTSLQNQKSFNSLLSTNSCKMSCHSVTSQQPGRGAQALTASQHEKADNVFSSYLLYFLFNAIFYRGEM